jgi:P27 family predicted phage terminase small subunit
MARPKKSLALHALQGTTPEWAAGAVQYRAGKPKMPPDLPEAGKAKWREMVALLHSRGTLTRADGPVLELYIATWLRWRALLKEIEERGVMVEDEYQTKSGESYTRRVANPAVKMAHALETSLRLLFKEFSCTPASRQATTPAVQAGEQRTLGSQTNEIVDV